MLRARVRYRTIERLYLRRSARITWAVAIAISISFDACQERRAVDGSENSRESDSRFFAAGEEKEREEKRHRKRRVHCVGRNGQAKKKEKSRKRDHGENAVHGVESAKEAEGGGGGGGLNGIVARVVNNRPPLYRSEWLVAHVKASRCRASRRANASEDRVLFVLSHRARCPLNDDAAPAMIRHDNGR